MSSIANNESSFFKVRTSFLTLSNFGCYILKLVRRNLDVYKSMIKKNLLVLYLIASVMKEILLLAM